MDNLSLEFDDIFADYLIDSEGYLAHIGTDYLHPGQYTHTGSGRYHKGDGNNPFQHEEWRHDNFLDRVETLKKVGWTPTEANIKAEFGENATLKGYTKQLEWAKQKQKYELIKAAKELKAQGKTGQYIADKLGAKNESTVRGWLNSDEHTKCIATKSTADFLKKVCDEKGMIDVGKGVPEEIGITETMMSSALYWLEKEGYRVYGNRLEQPTNPNSNSKTTQTVLCPPGTPPSAVYDLEKVHSLNDYHVDNTGTNFDKLHYPASLDSKRVGVVYAEDGGVARDGLMLIRPGLMDCNIGDNHIAQVRVLVDGRSYLKGDAAYDVNGLIDKLAPGKDILFFSNKHKGDDFYSKVLKEVKPANKDTVNPFGTNLREIGGQSWYTDPKTGERKLNVVNIKSMEGDWSDWQDKLPSQFLSKQNKDLITRQLNLAKEQKMSEFNEVMSLTDPVVKRHYLSKLAKEFDTSAETLAAAPLPNQKYNVLVPIPSLKDTECYAPRYEDGTQLALVRYPHQGIFEIPIVTVNNKHKPAKDLLGTQIGDAIGINHRVAERLSGADFDGDTAMCIPLPKDKSFTISTKEQLPLLKGFDNKAEYQYDKREKVTYMKDGQEKSGWRYWRDGVEFKEMRNTNKEMGIISNLITDMTLLGANDRDLALATKHALVVIDAEKHGLDYQKSYVDNEIERLKKTYQSHVDLDGNIKVGGASTIISRAKSPTYVPKRQGDARVNVEGKPWYDPTKPEGSLIYKNTDELYYVDRHYSKKNNTNTYHTIDGQKITIDASDREAYARYAPTKVIDKNGNDTGRYTSPDGKYEYKVTMRKDKVSSMSVVDDADKLVSSSRHPTELLYRDYANFCKNLANRARVEMTKTENIKVNKEAQIEYAAEVESLKAKVAEAYTNKPREREAIRRANVEIQQWLKDNPTIKPTSKEAKKFKQLAMTKARNSVNSIKRADRNIEITDREWEAIQKGAVYAKTLESILSNSDPDRLRKLAMPKQERTVTAAQISRIKAKASNGVTLNDIAQDLGISVSTVEKYLKGE